MASIDGIEREKNQEAVLGTQEKPVRLTDLPESNAAVKTHAVGPQSIETIPEPRSGARIDKEKATPPPANAREIENVAWKAGVVPEKKPMPDFAFAVIKVAMAREAFGTKKLKLLSDQVKEQLGTIDLLLDLSSELTALPDKESHDITDKMKGVIAKLEAQKIQIWSGGGKIVREKVGEMKAQISSQIDKLRTALQTKISTEIQPEVNNLQSIMNIVQQIIRTDARLKEKATQIPR